MSTIQIQGGYPLSGTVQVQGAKNSILPILSASLLCQTPSVIHNCPAITDVDACLKILEHLGCKTKWEDHTVLVDSREAHCAAIPDQLMGEMRSSIVFLAAILARCGQAVLTFPGGCELGPRPIDLHLNALSQMGAHIEESHGRLYCSLPKGVFTGAEIVLPIPSVGATENIMIAASTAKGTTVIHNAAREPEIEDLASFINRCGGKVLGSGESTITVQGVPKLLGCDHRVIPDRIVTTTYMAALAITGGEGTFTHVEPRHIIPTLPFFQQSGCRITILGNQIRMKAPQRLQPMKQVITGYYPGFPTDAQPALMAMATVAKGTGIFIENIFENRFGHAGGLTRLGGRINIQGRMAVVEGVPALSGATVSAADLRGGAALVLAGLVAKGYTRVENAHYIARGYENIVADLNALGGQLCLVT